MTLTSIDHSLVFLKWPGLIADTVSAAKHLVRVILLLDPQKLAVILLAPESPLPLPGLQAVLRLVEVGGGAVLVHQGGKGCVHPLVLLLVCHLDLVAVHVIVEHLPVRLPEAWRQGAIGDLNILIRQVSSQKIATCAGSVIILITARLPGIDKIIHKVVF